MRYPFYAGKLINKQQTYGAYLTQSTTPMRAGPNVSAPILSMLAYQLIKEVPLSAMESYNTNLWHFVHTSELRYGYVAASTVQPIIDWQLEVKELDGWQITTLGYCDIH